MVTVQLSVNGRNTGIMEENIVKLILVLVMGLTACGDDSESHAYAQIEKMGKGHFLLAEDKGFSDITEDKDKEAYPYFLGFDLDTCIPTMRGYVQCQASYKWLKDEFCPNLEASFKKQWKQNREGIEEPEKQSKDTLKEKEQNEDLPYFFGFNPKACIPNLKKGYVRCQASYKWLKDELCPGLEASFKEQWKQNREGIEKI